MTVITGLFESAAASASAIRNLESRGIPHRDVSVVASERTRAEEFGIESKSKAAEGAAIGAGVGGAIGALVLGFTAVGAIATGGVGLVAAGPIVAALAGAGAGAAAGGAVGTAVGFAIPEHEVKFYDEAFRKGSVLVGVQCPNADRERVVRDVFKAAGASKVSNA